jgi:hypothetical protein
MVTYQTHPILLIWIAFPFLGFISLFGSGTTLLLISRSQQKAAAKLDAIADFQGIDGPDCIILEKVYVGAENKKCLAGTKCCGCEDIWYYNFEAPALSQSPSYLFRDEYVFQSSEERVERYYYTDDCCSEYDSIHQREWRVGTLTKCWQPRVAAREGLAKAYSCGNTDCIKIFDPQYVVDLARETAMTHHTGTTLLITSVPVCLLLLRRVISSVTSYRRASEAT